ncbi:MAG: bifunctional phosphopantothenoylcysteine decarboxylase/phosphopantothenate--cysteine ligase CoaBC [Polyangiaceae bacterium]
MNGRPVGAAHGGSVLAGRIIALCVTGSIAAYKAAEVARLLVTSGARVIPVMSASAARFLGPMTLTGLCGERASTDMWDPSFAGERHVSLSAEADGVVIAPATADVLSRLAHGRADDLVTALALCARGGIVAAPAMHPRMWQHPATQRNVEELARQGRVQLVGPVLGEVASGDVGLGRMAEPAAIVAAIAAALSPQDLVELRLVVTAGPTLEDVDPVRFLGNRSSGRMGFAVAARAAQRGADVTLIAGPVELPTPPGVRRIDVRGAMAMRAALWRALGDDLSRADALVMAAAVSDYRPAEVSPVKIKKSADRVSFDLVKNPDILAEVGLRRVGNRPVLVGFAVETAGEDGLVTYARRKLVEKRLDFVVANDAADSFGKGDNRGVFVGQDEVEAFSLRPKSDVADALLERVRLLAKSFWAIGGIERCE